ncbi:MAG: carbon storage regulator [Acidiferrobacteraceae bacterium]
MLILSRRIGEKITIDLAHDADPNLLARGLFADGPLEIRITHVRGAQVKLGLVVDRRLKILRAELLRRRAPDA